MAAIEEKPADSVQFARYADLFEMGNRIEESQNMEVEEIILKVARRDREIQFGRKVVQFNSRFLSQDAQAAITQEKVAASLATLQINLESIASACHIAGAVLSIPILGEGCGRALSTAASYQGQVTKSEEEMLGYSSQRTRDIVTELGQKIQSAEREQDQDASTIDRTIQNSRRQAELLAGGN